MSFTRGVFYSDIDYRPGPYCVAGVAIDLNETAINLFYTPLTHGTLKVPETEPMLTLSARGPSLDVRIWRLSRYYHDCAEGDVKQYWRCGNIRVVLIFGNLARKKNSRIQESRENYYYNSASEEKWKFANCEIRKKSQNQKFAKI